jgi:hypothetical protein
MIIEIRKLIKEVIKAICFKPEFWELPRLQGKVFEFDPLLETEISFL